MRQSKQNPGYRNCPFQFNFFMYKMLKCEEGKKGFLTLPFAAFDIDI